MASLLISLASSSVIPRDSFKRNIFFSPSSPTSINSFVTFSNAAKRASVAGSATFSIAVFNPEPISPPCFRVSVSSCATDSIFSLKSPVFTPNLSRMSKKDDPKFSPSFFASLEAPETSSKPSFIFFRSFPASSADSATSTKLPDVCLSSAFNRSVSLLVSFN